MQQLYLPLSLCGLPPLQLNVHSEKNKFIPHNMHYWPTLVNKVQTTYPLTNICLDIISEGGGLFTPKHHIKVTQ